MLDAFTPPNPEPAAPAAGAAGVPGAAPTPTPEAEAAADRALALYQRGESVTAIARELAVPVASVKGWRERGRWDELGPVLRINAALERRLVLLIGRDQKSGGDYKEIDLLTRQLERTARIQTGGRGAPDTDRGAREPNSGQRRSKDRDAPRRINDITPDQAAELSEAFRAGLFGYQEDWRLAGLVQRIRNILKARQIGATWYFAREAIECAARTGRNKIFLSASKAQASIFRSYIQQFVRETLNIDLTGDPIRLVNGAELYFLGTNAKTAQGYHGDVYLDEYFWIHRFLEFRKVVSGMAMHKKWRQTYISTPSSTTHEAYQFWTGELFNKGRKRVEQASFAVDHATLNNGMLCPDGQWRHIVNINDAIAGGCDLFDIEQLRLEYGEDEFNNLLLCQFIDDTLSAFSFATVNGCMVDSWEVWDDYRPFAARPVGDAPVWIGYDPAGESEEGDGAGICVLLPPEKPNGPHRALERQRLIGKSYEEQADTIIAMADRYNVQRIGIDVTGIGDAVARIVEKRFPVTRYTYNVALKSMMVMQCLNLMRKGRIQFDAGWSDMAQAFLAIRKELTAGGRSVTFSGGRTRATGHADLAWALMHALHHEPIENTTGARGALVEINHDE